MAYLHWRRKCTVLNAALRQSKNSDFVKPAAPTCNLDPEELKRNITDFVDSWKKGWKGHEHEAHKWKAGWEQFQLGRPYRQDARELRRKAKEELRRRNLPLPNQWVKYSRQHNFKEGLLSLFGGACMSFAFFKIGQEVLNSGIIHEIPNIKDPQAHG